MDRSLVAQELTITEFQVLVALQEAPARVLGIACRLRLDPGHVSRALARLQGRELVRRAHPWPRADWMLEPAAAVHLEVFEPGWLGLNDDLQRILGSGFSGSLVRLVDSLPHPVRRRNQGWTDD